MPDVEQQRLSGVAAKVAIRALREGELDAADRVMRIAFGTFVGVPDPSRSSATRTWFGRASEPSQAGHSQRSATVRLKLRDQVGKLRILRPSHGSGGPWGSRNC
jgi:hypothetical protein